MKELFHNGNELKKVKVEFNGEEISNPMLTSIEIRYKHNTPKILGKLVINDLIDINVHWKWRELTIKIFYMDLFDKTVCKEYRILDVKEAQDDQDKKIFVLEIQDKFSYILENSYLSKSFNGTVTDALQEYCTELGIDSFPWAELEINPCETSGEFTVPKHINNLEWFLETFRKCGFYFWQDKKKVIVKSLEELSPNMLPPNNESPNDYRNEIGNQMYQNKIIDFKPEYNVKKDQRPTQRSMWYNPELKYVEYKDDKVPTNDNSYLYNNDDTFNLQVDTKGQRDLVQHHMDFQEHKQDLRDSFMDESRLQMMVSGYEKNDLYQVYKLKLKGNYGSVESQNIGNHVVQGFYVSYSIVEKIMNLHMIQNIYLHRADLKRDKGFYTP